MATRVAAGLALALELPGIPPVALRSAQPPSRRVERLASPRAEARVVVGELALAADLAEAAPLLDWMHALQDGAARPTDATVLVADANRKLQRRLQARGLWLTGATITPLSAAAGRSPVVLSLRCQPDTLDELPGDGRPLAAPGGRRKALLSANFRVDGLPFDGAGVQDLALPALSAAVQRSGGRRPTLLSGAPVLGPLTLTLSARSVAPARAWLAKVLAPGGLPDAQGLTLGVALLDSTLKKALATVTLADCALTTVDESVLAAGGDAPATLGLGFSVARMTVALSP